MVTGAHTLTAEQKKKVGRRITCDQEPICRMSASIKLSGTLELKTLTCGCLYRTGNNEWDSYEDGRMLQSSSTALTLACLITMPRGLL